MQLTKGAIGNLINRYKAVLKKCHLMNTFGSLAVAGMLVMGGAAAAGAAEYTATNQEEFATAFDQALKDATASIKVTSPITNGSGIGIFNSAPNTQIKKLTIDFGGNTYTFMTNPVGSPGTETQAVHLEKGHTVILQNGKLEVGSTSDSNFKWGIQNYCDLTLENMVIDGSNLHASKPYTMSNNHGNVVIKHSTIIAKEGGIAFDVYYSESYKEGIRVTVTDSTIDGRIEVMVDDDTAIGDNPHSLSISGGTLVGGLTAQYGGQLYTVGTTSLSNVEINNNTATNCGGGIYNAVRYASDGNVGGRGQLTLDGVSFSGNKAAQGGAIYNAADSSITFKGTNTFSGNTAAEGKDIYNAGSLTMSFGSDLVVYGSGSILNAASGNINVENGARLTIADAVSGGTYTVVSGEGNISFTGGGYNAANSTGWKGENLQASSDMVILTSTDGKTFTAEGRDAHDVFTGLDDGLADAVNSLYARHGAAGTNGWNYADVDAEERGIRFLSRATDKRFIGADHQAAAATIESAARIAFAGAVPQMTKMASDAASNAVVNRLGFANPADGAQAMDAEGKIVDRNTTGFALWIAPLWQSQHGWGMEAGNLDYGFNGNLGGVSLGADYTFENAIRAGITFNIGGGYAESSGGDLNSTENNMSFWGLGAYAGWNYENFGLMADVSYTSTWNDLKQDLDSRMGMGDLEADVQASAISAGLRAEYKLETSVLDVIPHIGVRYMSLNTWGFDAESNGGTVLEGDGFHQDIWTFPVGVTFTKDFTLDSGWSFKPSIDFSVIPAAGDIKAKQDVAFTGLPGTYEVETQMMDYLTWQGGVGLELGNDTMSFGVNYTLQAGQHTTGHGVFGSFRYEF